MAQIIDIRQLPTGPALTSAYILSTLVHHDWDEISPALTRDEKAILASDVPGEMTLTAFPRKFTIEFPTANRRISSDRWKHENPGTTFENIFNAPGVFYRARDGPLPSDETAFWIQQYPRNAPNPIGRTVVELYTDNVITGVFKTDVDNFGALGTAKWEKMTEEKSVI